MYMGRKRNPKAPRSVAGGNTNAAQFHHQGYARNIQEKVTELRKPSQNFN